VACGLIAGSSQHAQMADARPPAWKLVRCDLQMADARPPASQRYDLQMAEVEEPHPVPIELIDDSGLIAQVTHCGLGMGTICRWVIAGSSQQPYFAAPAWIEGRQLSKEKLIAYFNSPWP
jgi:hypothetical protein